VLDPPLPDDIVRLNRSSQGVDLYFPSWRNAGAAVALALFGIACFIPGAFAAIAITPLATSGPAGELAIWLMSIFILPFIAFGVLFLALAVYQVANSLAVSVTQSEVRSLRRIFGVPLPERRVATGEIAALDALTVVRHRRPREDASYYSLVARTRDRKVTVAESLRGETLMEQVRTEIAKAGRLEHLL
jgi:hypothetical protein